MKENEATARVLINRLLEQAGWRFFDEDGKPANIQLERGVKLERTQLDGLGENFERTINGYIDFLLLDSRGRPLVVLEAKAPYRDPLDGKEQARRYAHSQNCRYVILSNGMIHYFWDLKQGNPHIITAFPRPGSLEEHNRAIVADPSRLINEEVRHDYIVLTQDPNYINNESYKDESTPQSFIEKNKLRFLRDYQLSAIHALQEAVRNGKTRFLFEMATGTGKTLTAAAVIKLFLKTGNAHRILFLVDRLELESQAYKAFHDYLKNDYETIIYKENRDDWRSKEIVVTTIQTLLFDNKYQRLFSPTDFDLVISDEAHRSIGGNSRAVFEYFIGYKLGLTATPKDYLKNLDVEHILQNDPRAYERRVLLDTYRTFGCENSEPTFRYSLLDGVKDGFLINPIVVDARTEVTTKLLSEKGFIVNIQEGVEIDKDETEEKSKTEVYKIRHFEKKFFSEATNKLFCTIFLKEALRDPITNEIGKSIVYCVSQNHASKITQILNEFADKMFPNIYQSDFAVQVTSFIPDAQKFTIDFANNILNGHSSVVHGYNTSKTRVCVTVGMMTTGYDCTDILNIVMMRPIFSPTDFIQIKGRGTRKHDFLQDLHDENLKQELGEKKKQEFKLFDFFANVEYFEEDYRYDQVIPLPPTGETPPWVEGGGENGGADEDGPPPEPPQPRDNQFHYGGSDDITAFEVQQIGLQGMRIDRMYFMGFEDKVKSDEQIVKAIEAGQWEKVIEYVNQKYFNKPEEYYTLEKLRKAAEVDRRITLKEILEKIFGLIPRFKSKNELLEEEFAKFVAEHQPPNESLPAIKYFFKAYLSSLRVQQIIESKDFSELATCSELPMQDYEAVPEKYRQLIPEYIKDYVPLNQFAA